uniref:DNA 3'-5' helicase n=1 Tax=candidate division WOR-3 bacterium TaxID=2052148 RepID=A0A7C4XJ52_UNCW3
MLLKNQLNKEQLNAVQIDRGPILILAGAGSGKTTVITHRIYYLIKEKNVNPLNILAVTFTNKAADEMKSRIYYLLNNQDPEIWIRTYHSTCAKILRGASELIDIPRNFTIYDEYDQISLIREVLKELNINAIELKPDYILRMINRAKENLISPEEYDGPPLIKTVYKLYNHRLREYNALDFDDLIYKTIELFKKDKETLEYYQNRFQFILVDEYQDTNYAQYVLTKMLAERHRNLCVVGDDDQSIYSWRGAEIKNILNFERDYPDVAIIKLEQNYRSTKIILNAASEVVKNNRYRKKKTLWCENEIGEKIEFYNAEDDEGEASYVARKIHQAKIMGKGPGEIAIFYRLNYQSRIFEDYLLNYKIPYEVVGGLKFYERIEIKDILAYLRIIDNPQDSVSLKRIINLRAKNIGNETLKKIIDYQKRKRKSLFEALKMVDDIPGLRPRAKMDVKAFVEIIEKLRRLGSELDLYNLALWIVADTGYLDGLMNNESEAELNRRKNIEELLKAIKGFVETNPKATLSEYLESVSLRSEIDEWSNKAKVSLMTLHNAKGLEFETVFITGLEDGLLPHQKSETEELYEEERRLFYVGITRAKKKLYLTCANRRKTYRGNYITTKPSPFLREIPNNLFATVYD